MEHDGSILWIAMIAALIWLVLLFVIFRQIANRTDISLPVKAFWIIVIFMAPVIGLVIYLAVGKRSVRRPQ